MDKEIWKPIPGYENRYEVSNLGRVRNFVSKLPIKPYITRRGYVNFLLYENISRKRKHFAAHRLVAIAFLPNPNDLPQVNHKNGIKTDNRVENLEWCDNEQNRKHAIKYGLLKIGIDDPQSRFSRKDLEEIRNEYVKNSRTHGMPALARKYNVSVTAIYFVIHNKHYKEE